MKNLFQNIFFVFFFPILFISPVFPQPINPENFIATLQYDGCDFFDAGESNFPMSFLYNTSQDANGDSMNDVEDNLENLVLYSINDSVYGTGRTGLTGRGPNDQRPAVYFHLATIAGYDVYEYWLYYADNNWINDHEHDWEKYFVYVQDTIPYYILLSSHTTYNIYSWADIISYNYHAYAGVDGGSHAMKNSSEDGVSIGYDGSIIKNNGTLLTPDSINLPWIIFSNDSNVINCSQYIQSPDTFYYGDPSYLTNSNEWGDPNPAPWIRDEWDNPPAPVASGFFSDDKEIVVACYPNPVNEKFFIEFKNIQAGYIQLFTSDGLLILENNISGKIREIIDVSNFKRGIYFLKIFSEEKNISKKIIIL